MLLLLGVVGGYRFPYYRGGQFASRKGGPFHRLIVSLSRPLSAFYDHADG